MSATVLVTDGDERATLALVRSLGRAGHRVLTCSPRGRSLAGASRHCRGEIPTPDPLADPRGYVERVAGVVEREGVEVLIPTTEAAMLALLAERHRFPGTRIPFPELDTFRAVCDKRRVLEAAAALGLAVPEQWVLEHPGDRAVLDRVEHRFPVVVKPSRSIGEHEGQRAKNTVRYASDRAELDRILASLPATAFPLLVQQRIVGPGVGVFLLLWDGEVRATFAHRRLREKPPSGGVSVYRESVAADPQLLRAAVALLQHFGWTGVAMVEFKVDAATGTPYLMEINGRFWGSLQLAIDAGVDFPALLVDAVLGRDAPAQAGYRLGVRSRWWWGDVDQVLTRLRRSDAELGLPPDAASRARSLLDFLVLWRPGDHNETLRLGDPLPFFRESIQWFRSLR